MFAKLCSKLAFRDSKLKFQGGTRVSKTRVVCDGHHIRKKNPCGNWVFKTRFPVFTCSSSSSTGSFVFSIPVFLPPWVPLFFLFSWVPLFFFFLSYMGSSLHLLSFFNFFRSFCSSFFVKFFFFFYRTRVPRGKKIFMSIIKTRSFEAWFLHLTRALKAWDVTLLNSF